MISIFSNIKKTFALAFILSILFTSIYASEDESIAALKSLSKGFAAIAKTATPAVVSINGSAKRYYSNFNSAQERNPFDLFNRDFFRHFFNIPHDRQQHQFQDRDPIESQSMLRGSGVVISADGYIITNNHVIHNADNITVLFNDGMELSAKIIGTDSMADLAVLKVEATNLPCLTFGDSDKLEVGEWVIAIGSPLKFEASLTVGVVSAKGRSGLSITSQEDFIQTDAAINPGNSGGPLLNLDKKVIGINTAIATTSGGYMGIGFAIPSNMVKNITDQIIETGSITRGFLGIFLQPVSNDLAKSFNLDKVEGALIVQVLKDTPAEKAGLKQGDIVLKYNDIPVKNVGNLINGISMISPGTEVVLTIFRNNKTIKVPLKVGSRPSDESKKEHFEDALGFEIIELNDEMRQQFGYTEDKGIVISDIDPSSPAAALGIQPGTLILSINQEPISSVEEFYQVIDKVTKAKNKRILLLIKFKQAIRFITLPVK